MVFFLEDWKLCEIDCVNKPKNDELSINQREALLITNEGVKLQIYPLNGNGNFSYLAFGFECIAIVIMLPA